MFADVGKGSRGKSRHGRVSYEPALILETYVGPQEEGSSRLNCGVDVMCFVNEEMLRDGGYGIDAENKVPDLGQYGWVLATHSGSYKPIFWISFSQILKIAVTAGGRWHAVACVACLRGH